MQDFGAMSAAPSASSSPLRAAPFLERALLFTLLARLAPRWEKGEAALTTSSFKWKWREGYYLLLEAP
jgi:hypothetical protein